MKKLFHLLLPIILISCHDGDNDADAYGNFEAVEIIVSAEVTGKLTSFSVEEGSKVQKVQKLGIIDTTQLYLNKQQLIYSIAALKSKVQNVKVQVDILRDQKQNLMREKKRLDNLFQDNAATQKQLDDINGEIDVVESRILATRTQMNTANQGLLSEIAPLEIQIEQINDQLTKSYLYSPINGTILSSFAEEGEFVTTGKPLFKVANLDKMELRVYVSGDQVANIKLGDTVDVLVDKDKKNNRMLAGKISWISSQAEFTPKIIQTKEERVNLVYALKIQTPNDGTLKIGMPGEIRLKN